MPEPDRDTSATVFAGRRTGEPGHLAALSGNGVRQLRERAVDVLLAESLAPAVALVAWRDGDWVHVADRGGEVRFAVADPQVPHPVRGRDPVALQDPLVEADDCYPHAGVRLVDAFRDPDRRPDVVVVHSGAHSWPERGGHAGEHGSLNAVQSRAPFLLSGAGVRAHGVLEDSVRTVDVAATLCHVLRAPADDMDGRPRGDLVEPGAPLVLGLLWDGAPSADVLAGAADGSLPAVARLLERGCALRGGAVAEFPSVTLVNHTSALTGVGPGRHGVVHNAYYDRATATRTVPNDSSTWHRASEWLRPGVRTVFERLAQARPDAVSACVDEPTDRGATHSTFGLVRAASASGDGGSGDGGSGESLRLVDLLPPAAGDPHATAVHVAGNSHYAWATQVDSAGLAQVRGLLDGTPPSFLWWNSIVTDTGHHEGGRGSAMARAALADTDRRLGVVLDLLEERGLAQGTTVLLTADHGMQSADPAVVGDWDEPLAAAGIPFRDEGYGFLYLGV